MEIKNNNYWFTKTATLGIKCEIDIDECASHPCLHGAKCIDYVNAYSCECLDGYGGHNCIRNEDDCTLRLTEYTWNQQFYSTQSKLLLIATCLKNN